jgi:competence protein ComEC
MAVNLAARVLEREEQPAETRVRLLLATREPETGRAIRVRVNLAQKDDVPGLVEGAGIRLRARLVPPAPPMLPGGYDFARTAWFMGLAATGSVLEPPQVIEPGDSPGWLGRMRAALSRHVRSRLDGSPGALAAAFASGDRGAIAPADDQAMRDAGLTHLLSISGLHVSAVIAAVYLVALRLLALWPWLALRVRLPIFAAGAGALAGVFYTLQTGAEVPTVRSCVGALLVLAALALGREPLSLRLLAVAAFLVMLLWPEAVVGPSFQMSFAAVIAIISLHGAAPVRAFLAPRGESWIVRMLRDLAMLLLTGLVIELALMPIGLFHFHRAGVYGAMANVVAIPLTTFVSMPLIGIALLFDLVGAGAPFWWLAGKSLELLLAIAHWTASQPGAVTVLPAMGLGSAMLFTAGGLWLALWRGRVRLGGLVPLLLGAVSLALLRPPDLLVSGDGRHAGITTADGTGLLVLREGRGGYANENLA